MVAQAIDFHQVKSRVDELSYLSAALGPAHKQGRDYWWTCPFHQEATASFSLYEKNDGWRIHCFGCLWNNGSGDGDILDFVQKHENVSLREAVELLGNRVPATPVLHYESKRQDDRPGLTIVDAKRPYEMGIHKALPYFTGRAISEEVVHQNQLGYFPRWQIDKEYHSVKLNKGNWVSVPVRWYTIPYIFGNDVWMIKFRRDDEFVEEAIKNLSDETLSKVAKHLYEKRGHVTSFDDVKKFLYQHKYIADRRGKYTKMPFGLDLFIDPANKQPIRHTYMLITEDECSQMALRSAGYPSLMIPQARNNILQALPNKLLHIPRVVIIADRDASHAGEEKAIWTRNLFGRGTIILPPEHFNDADDVAIGGNLKKWLSSHNVYPEGV